MTQFLPAENKSAKHRFLSDNYKKIYDMSDFNQIIQENKPTLVDFFATWCGPCRAQAPILEAVKQKMGDKANILKVDVDQNQALAQQFRVSSIPTLILFKNGMAVWRGVGVHQEDMLVQKLTDHLETKSDEF